MAARGTPKNRWAAVGDLIFHTVGNNQYMGVIYEIISDKYNHKTAFIKWTTETPPPYREESGYSLTNIHNLRREFDLEKG